MTFSLIILAYNSGKYLDRCLSALVPFDAEIICADNGSTDGTDFDGLKAKFPKVRFDLHGANLGFAAGNNRAAAEASGEWLGFINPDAFADAGWLDAITAAMAADPAARLFTSLQRDAVDPSKMDGAGDAMTFFGFPYRMGFGQALPADLPAATVFSPCGAAFVIHCDLWRQLGGFDERFFTYCEDADLGFRAQLLGHACRFVPQARVDHVGSASTSVRSDFALYYGYRNRLWLYLKNMPLSLLIPTLPLHIGLTLLGALNDTRKGRGRTAWRGLKDAISGMGPILKSRNTIAKSRQISALRLASRLTWNPVKIARRALDHRRLR